MPTFISPTLLHGTGGGREDTAAVFSLRLAKKEALLAQDGILSPADYRELIKDAQSYTSQLRTPSARASFSESHTVRYQKQIDELKNRETDIPNLNEGLEDDRRQAGIFYGDNPDKYVNAVIDSLRAKAEILQERLSTASEQQDRVSVTTLSNEFVNTKDLVERWTATLASYNSGQKDALQAYITPAADTGLPIKVEYVPPGLESIKGTKPTNSTIDGMPLNLTLTSKSGSYFMGKKFSSPNLYDYPIPDPVTKQMINPTPLTIRDVNFRSSNVDFKSTDIYGGRGIGVGEYARGVDGKTLYRNVDGQNYTKFINVMPQDLNLDPLQIRDLSIGWENNLRPLVTQKIDGKSLVKPKGFTFTPADKVGAEGLRRAIEQQPRLAAEVNQPVTAAVKQPPTMGEPTGAENQAAVTEQITKGGWGRKLWRGAKSLIGL